MPLEETTCCVCLELLQAPRVLSCGHPVCLQCTERITSITIFKNNNIDNNINIKTSTNVNDGNNGKPVLRCPQCHSLTKVQDLREAVESPSSPGISNLPFNQVFLVHVLIVSLQQISCVAIAKRCQPLEYV